MAKLVIQIEFGNDAMQRYSQARACIKDALGFSNDRNRKPESGDYGSLRDVNGNRVGEWEVYDDDVPFQITIARKH